MSRSEVLVDAEWVVAHAEDPTVVLVEVDEDTAIYATGHIRGAVRLDWRTDLQDGVGRDVVDSQRPDRGSGVDVRAASVD
jgi:thiosulfate/3-mercaptopyruvate sulfurtransferase